jgi:hypothetical protein
MTKTTLVDNFEIVITHKPLEVRNFGVYHILYSFNYGENIKKIQGHRVAWPGCFDLELLVL